MRREKLPVTLFIRGEQYFDDVDPDATELVTEVGYRNINKSQTPAKKGTE